MKLLLHACCGPCFLGVWEELGTHKDIETTLYYDNPNIYPASEFAKRRDYLRIAAKIKGLALVEAEYRPEEYKLAIDDDTAFPIRCLHCYRLRLERAAKYAKENGYEAISTTLFVSPYQQHEALQEVAADVAQHYGLELYYTDWRPFFREGQTEAREMDLYRQKYCGCSYSLQESKKNQ